MHRLKFIGISLDQRILNNLPNLNNRLTSLVLRGLELVTDFSFILRLEQLERFKISQQLGSLELTAKVFQQLNQLTSFEFGAAVNESVIIEHTESSYTLRFPKGYNDYSQIENLTWAELVTLNGQRAAGQRASKRKEIE